MRSGRAAGIHDWLTALVAPEQDALGPDEGLHAEPLPAALVEGTPDDFAAGSFRFSGPDRGLSDPGRHLVHVLFAPGGRRRAVTVRRADWDGALIWLDGAVVPVPRDDRGPLADAPGHWPDDTTYAVPVGGLRDHPLHDPREISTLGTVLGLLVCDGEPAAVSLHVPADDEAWRSPRLVRRDGALVVDPGGA